MNSYSGESIYLLSSFKGIGLVISFQPLIVPIIITLIPKEMTIPWTKTCPKTCMIRVLIFEEAIEYTKQMDELN